MQRLESFIKDFCKSNAGKDSIDFSIFKNPEDLSHQLGFVFPLNQFKGLLLERLLEELFLGNGYLVERLGEGGKDGGCDLLVKYRDNSVRFVLQAKNWNKHIDLYDVKKEHLKFTDNYLTKYSLNNTHFCFVAWGYVGRIKSQLLNKLNIKVWDEQDLIDNLFKNYKSSHPQYPTVVLEPYQQSAFEKILEYWNDNKRCYVEHCTGTGKTYIIAKLTQYLLEDLSNRILILSPSRYINDRIMRLLETVTSRNHISTRYSSTNRINLLTYQYLMHNAGKRSIKGSFSHIIMDEVHRAGAPEWHTRGLLNAIDDGTKLVGLSATMQRYSGGFDVKDFLDSNSAGTLTLFQAMARGILPVGEYVYSVLDMQSKVQELTEEIESKCDKAPSKKERLLEKLNAREIKDYSIQNIIYKYYHELKYRKMIAFCEDIEHTIDTGALLEKTFMKFCKVKQFKVHSKNSKAGNDEQLKQFSETVTAKKEIFILNAVDMLNEGIDVPGIDSVMLFRRTESPRIYLQQIGRSIRRHGKENPLIFDCVLNYQNVKIPFISEAKKEFDNYRKALEEFNFKDIDVSKTIHVYDEVESISRIIEEVEKRLNLYPTYEEAKRAVQRLNIKSNPEYQKRYKEDPRLPSNPNATYADKGWIGSLDFFGRPTPVFYPTYEEAKQAVAVINIKNQVEYKSRYKEDPRLPADPYRFYNNKGWVNFFDFLGRPTPDFYPTYAEAKWAVSELNIKNQSEYWKRYKEDPGLPANPNAIYADKGWINWFDFFNKPKPDFYPTYAEAKQAVQRLTIKSRTEYLKRHKEDPRLPANPNEFYKDKGWVNGFDFYVKPTPDFYPTYAEAKWAVAKINIKNKTEYKKRYKEDPRLPANPNEFYKDKGWVNGFDFFVQPFYPTYEEAKQAVKRLNIKTSTEYYKRYKEDPRLPANPDTFYKDNEWIDWFDFLGNPTPDLYPTYAEAKRAVQRLNIKSFTEYNKHYKEDPRLPSHPNEVYSDNGWIGWFDLFGKPTPDLYPTYEEAKQAVQRLNIKTVTEYLKRCKEDPRLSSVPKRTYNDKGWIDWFDFFCKPTADLYPTYTEAQQAVAQLNIKSKTEYKKRYKEDPRLPSNPNRTYANKGWIGSFDFLGKDKK